jgi:hypothetical protein
MRNVVAFFLAVLLLVPPSAVTAQPPPPVEPGAQVRVTASDCGFDKHAATLESLRGDRLVFDMTECPLGSVTRLDVHRGRKSNVGKGALYGFLTGAVVGGVVGAIEGDGAMVSTEGAVAVWGVGIGAVGAVVGAITGAFIKTDRWEEVPLDRFRLSLAPKWDGFAVGLRIAF